MRFRQAVREEFERRRAVNPRYSLRRFAAVLGVHHATLSRLLNGSRPVPARTVRAVAAALGFNEAEVARFIAQEDAAAVIAAVRRPGFRPDCRSIAAAANIPIDNVNIALHTLISGARLRLVSATEWVVAGHAHE